MNGRRAMQLPKDSGDLVIKMVKIACIMGFLTFVIMPLYWVIVTSIKPVDDYQKTPPVWFPDTPTLIHYQAALTTYGGLHGLLNSVVVAIPTMLLTIIVGAPLAYSMARFRLSRQYLGFWILSQRFMPPIAIVLPLFLLYRDWSLYDTRLGLVLVYTVSTLPFCSWMMYTYIRQLPVDIEEAALVDGCSRLQVIWQIVRPLAMPSIASAMVFAFIFAWTEFFFAVMLTSRSAYTLPSLFRQFLAFQAGQYGESSALSVISLIPSLILGTLLYRHLTKGLTMGAVSGI